MTTDKIDVLAVMDRLLELPYAAHGIAEIYEIRPAVAELIAERDALREELRLRQRFQKLPASDSAALAELIEAATKLVNRTGIAMQCGDDEARLRAAISKATGVSA